MRIFLSSVLLAVSVQAIAESSPWQTLNNVMGTKKAVEESVQTAPAAATQATTSQIQNYGELISGLASVGQTDTKTAEGGLGSLLGLAKSSLDATQFGQLSQAFPDVQGLLGMAPAVTQSESSGLKSMASGLLGGKADKTLATLDKAAQVKQQFDSLGLSADMIPQFVNLLQNYLQGQSVTGGVDYAGLLQMGLGALGQ